eukprot:Hpha_TRINITY_DN23712_c0_g1::TRINITY_DN23712_c0_g1_i1::g.93139::m.93139
MGILLGCCKSAVSFTKTSVGGSDLKEALLKNAVDLSGQYSTTDHHQYEQPARPLPATLVGMHEFSLYALIPKPPEEPGAACFDQTWLGKEVISSEVILYERAKKLRG